MYDRSRPPTDIVPSTERIWAPTGRRASVRQARAAARTLNRTMKRERRGRRSDRRLPPRLDSTLDCREPLGRVLDGVLGRLHGWGEVPARGALHFAEMVLG